MAACVDLGCGTGISTRRIAARFPKASSILGIVASPHFLQVGRRLNQLGTKDRNAWEWINAIDEGGYTDTRVELRHGLAEDTKLADASVDVVNLGLVIHELPPSATMDIAREIYRILKPDGQLWITEWTSRHPHSQASVKPDAILADTLDRLYLDVMQTISRIRQ